MLPLPIFDTRIKSKYICVCIYGDRTRDLSHTQKKYFIYLWISYHIYIYIYICMHWPLGYEPNARFELATPCLQGRCNNHYATSAYYIYVYDNNNNIYFIRAWKYIFFIRVWKYIYIAYSSSGNRTRVARVKTWYPDHLD